MMEGMVATNDLTEAVAISLGPTIALVAGALINWRVATRATKAAAKAQEATARAGIDAMRAQGAASNAAAQAAIAAARLIETARVSNSKLDQIAATGAATHKIVNSARTVMLNLVATLTERIAAENPEDATAQAAAKIARAEANDAVAAGRTDGP
jgi:hypothetical protein